MKQLSAAAVERAMKLQDVMLRAQVGKMAKRINWYQAAEILGISLPADAALEDAL
ncbi:MAG: hypothetical protein ABR555_15660 [Pyrinomonadaceae bacterium]